MSLRPKPQRLKQRVIPEMNPEDRMRSARDNYKLRLKMKYEAKTKPRIKPEQKMRETDQKVEPDTRSENIRSSETIADHNKKLEHNLEYKIKLEPKLEYKIKPEPKLEHKMKPEAKLELKMKSEAKPDLKMKPEIKPAIKEKSDSIKAEQKVKVENIKKTEIIKSDQRVKEIRSEQKATTELISEQKVKPEISKLDQKLKVERKTVAPLDSIDNSAIPIEDIIEEELPVDKHPEGHYELNPLMTRMVEAELQDIMIKVWQELPDNSQDEGEKLVADKLRNVAGDDIRNVLGLNVTKRLLNVYNPLFVKIQFSGKPDRVNLAKFLRKYNFIAFKRIDKADVFAAQLKTIKDFDRICIAKDIMCGDVKVTVNPCYRFTKCPANLRSAFDDKSDDDEKEETAEVKDVHKSKDVVNVATKLESNLAKSQNTVSNSNVDKTMPNTIKSEANVDKPKPSTETKTDSAKIIKSEEKKGIPPTESETNMAKSSPAKSETNIAKSGSNIAGVKAHTTQNVSKRPLTDSIATNSKQNIIIAKLTINTQSKSNKVENKVTINKLNESKVTGNEQSIKAEKNDGNKSDNDELDDNDMFALISGGIVLDECSGSDEE